MMMTRLPDALRFLPLLVEPYCSTDFGDHSAEVLGSCHLMRGHCWEYQEPYGFSLRLYSLHQGVCVEMLVSGKCEKKRDGEM
jgi:hypothetical protein